MPYVLIVAFHLHLNLRKIIVQRSYGHSLEELTTIYYLTNDQVSFRHWLNEKIKSQHLELDVLEKNQYERKHPIDWQKLIRWGTMYRIPKCLLVVCGTQIFEKYIFRF